MQQEARSTAQLEAVTWRAPPDWIAPDWLDAEPGPATLPMTKERMRWCMHAIGWPTAELARRVHTHESSIRQMARDRRPIPDVLALWLEYWAKVALSGPLLPSGWRPKPQPQPGSSNTARASADLHAEP